MKVKKEEFKAALILFQNEFVESFDTGSQKFVVGIALAAMDRRMDDIISRFSDKDGMVDVDSVRSLVDAGMEKCGGKFDLPINFGALSMFGVPPANITIDKDDMDNFFDKTLPSVSQQTIQQKE